MARDFKANGIAWDLSDLYTSLTDPQIDQHQGEILKKVQAFNKAYKGNINTPDLAANFLHDALKEYEEISLLLYRIVQYAGLYYSKHTSDDAAGAFYQKSQEFANNVSTQLLWFELEWIAVDDALAQPLISDDTLSYYKHYLEQTRISKPYVLPEKEEQLLALKSQTSSDAFTRLYDQINSEVTYSIVLDGEKQDLSYAEVMSVMSNHEDREVRQSAAEALTAGLQPYVRTYSYILNMLLFDKQIADNIRQYEYPQQSTFLEYELKPETVEEITSVTEEHYPLVQDFYAAKKAVLGYETLYEWDRYSDLYPEKNKKYTWDEARDIVLSAFSKFNPQFNDIAQEFFEKRWIDAEIIPGKRSGGYCSLGQPDGHPYIFMNYNGDLSDVMTLAHELGHGIHAYLSREQKMLEFYPSTAIAEIASVFGEILVFEEIYETLEDRDLKINLMANKLQGSFATVFRQTAFYLFENDIHEHRREMGELLISDFNQYFQQRLQAMFGESLTLTEGHASWWMPVMHFYHYNFYVFTYAFGELLTLSLYARYKKQQNDFIQGYVSALSCGGSKSPYEITKMMGVDINNPAFWNQGFELLHEYVDQFKGLVQQDD